LLLSLIGVGISSATIQLALVDDFGSTYLAIMGAVLLLAAGYGLARSVRFRIAAQIVSFVPVVAGAAVGWGDAGDPAWYAFMCLGMVLAVAFLAARQVAVIGVVTVLLALAVLTLATPPVAPQRTVAIVAFLGAMGALVILTSRHLHLVEVDREGALRESAARYQQLFDHAPIGIGVAALTGRVLEANETLLQLLRYRREQLVELVDVTSLYAETEARERLLQQLRTPGSIVREEAELRRGDGTLFHAQLSLVAFTLRGEPCVLALVEDTEARRRAEEDRAYLADMLERSVNEVYSFDAETLRFDYANEGARHNLGYTVEQLRQMTPVDLKPEFTTDTFRQVIAALVRGEIPVLAFETQHRRADGTLYPVDVRLQRTTRHGRTMLQAMILDISERRQLQSELLQAQKLESVGRLAGGVAHDFNNLLTVIRANIELAREDIGVNHRADEELSEALRAADSASSLTRQLLAFSRRQVIAPRVLDLNTVVVDLERMVRRLLNEDIALDTHLTPTLGLVRADPNQIEQVLVNLTVNARDAMPDGGRLTIATGNAREGEPGPDGKPAPPGDWVWVAVSDTGEGMSEDTAARVFEPFFTTKQPGAGTGLGLASVEGAVSQNGGRVRVASSSGQGSTFTVFLPRVAAERAALRRTAPVTTPRGGETILLVEDDDAVRTISERMLRLLGYAVLSAPHGEAALALARQHVGPLDLVLTDVIMPGMNGQQLATALLEMHPGVRVLHTSGYTADLIAKHGVLDEGVEFLPKPYSIHDLGQRVRQVLDREAASTLAS